MVNRWYDFSNLPPREHDGWVEGSAKGDSPWDTMEHHVDIGCGTCPKARLGIDRYSAPGVDLVMELDDPAVWLPFDDSSIKSVISHHFFEHCGSGFIPLVDEIYRVLMPGGILRAITPLFPCTAAVEDPDHCRYFMAHQGGGGTWDAFCGDPNTPHWTESFSVPYTTARFRKVDQILTPRVIDVQDWWGPHDQRELRVALEACK